MAEVATSTGQRRRMGTSPYFGFFETYGDGWAPGSIQLICRNDVVIEDGTPSPVYVELCEIDSDGNVINSLCRVSMQSSGGGPFGGYASVGLDFDEEYGVCNAIQAEEDLPGEVRVYIPSTSETSAYYGMRTWHDDETKPGFPESGGVVKGYEPQVEDDTARDFEAEQWTSSRLELGWSGLFYNHCGYRFPDVDIPQGSEIRGAVLELPRGGGGSDCLTDVYGQNTGDAPKFQDYEDPNPNMVHNRARTGASVVWNDPGGTLGITNIVQEIINRYDWSSGNALAILHITNPDSTDYRNVGSPNLFIEYKPPS